MRTMHRGQRGTAVVEAAIVLPLFVLLLIGLLEFGLIFNNYLVLQTATREGARLGAVGGSADNIEQRVRDFSQTLDQTNLTVTVTNAQGVRGSTLAIGATYPVPLITFLMTELVGDSSFMLAADASMRLE